MLSRDPLSQGPIGGGSKLPRPRGTRPTPKNTKKAPPRTLPRVPWAQRDRPRRQTHLPRGASFLERPAIPKQHCEAVSLDVRSRAANHALNIQPPSRPRPTHSAPYAREGASLAPPPWRSTRISPGALFSRAERPPPARQRLSTLAAAAHDAPTRKPPSRKGRAAALPERAREQKIHRAHARRRHPKLFTSLCARKRAQNINSRAPATHRT